MAAECKAVTAANLDSERETLVGLFDQATVSFEKSATTLIHLT